jgi:XTP/dITP diphosphohydrolase
MKTLLIATTNQGKIRELKALLGNLPVRLVTPQDLKITIAVEETGDTYKENATLKAVAYSNTSGLITLADDSGLEVAALNGAPGIRSARYAPKPGATDADRRAYLLDRLRPTPRPWTARFYCLVCIAEPAGNCYYTEGICTGEIIPQERGKEGFGYDPIFYLPDKHQTMAELEMNLKNRLSHRARAVAAALPVLNQLFAQRA